MPGKDDNSSSPLMRAIRDASPGVEVPRPSAATRRVLLSSESTPWRKNLEEFIRASVPTISKRAGMSDRLDAIERASGMRDEIVLPSINAVCQQKIAPLGEDAVCAFLDAMYLVSIRARKEYPDDAGDATLDKRVSSMCACAEKLGAIAANVSNEKVFCLMCAGMERIKDFNVTSKYINYMFAASKEIRSERNPEGVVRNAEAIAFDAKFIADRSDGTNAKYVDELLRILLFKLNEPDGTL